MVIIFDDNEYSRDRMRTSFRMADVPMITRAYRNYFDYEKPLLTVLINPNPKLINEYLSCKDTAFLIISRQMHPEYELAKNVIIREKPEASPTEAINIIKEEYGFSFVQDTLNFITVVDDSEESDVYFGGHKLNLTKTQYYILKFFAYQRFKKFDVDLLREYLFLERRLKASSVEGIISTINGKCRDEYREKIILKDIMGCYRITEVTGALPWNKKGNPYTW